MDDIAKRMKAYIETHPFDSGKSDCETVLDQLYQAYSESHESGPEEIKEGFKNLEDILCVLSLKDNNEVFSLCCRLCMQYKTCAPYSNTSASSSVASKRYMTGLKPSLQQS